MEAGLPEEESAQAKEGTLLHALDASPDIDRVGLKPNQRDLLKTSAALEAFVYNRVQEQFLIPPDEACEEGHERSMSVKLSDGIRLSGHCDQWRYYPAYKLLVVIDKKFGYAEVTPAVANLQLRAYAVMGTEERDCENVVVAINQPRLDYERRVTMAAYTREDLGAAQLELSNILRTAARADAPLVAGEEQCRYCKAKLVCAAYREKFLSINQPAARSLAECTDEQLGIVLVAIQFADFIKEQAREEARARIRAGGLPGYKLGKETTMREITDPARAVRLLVLGASLTQADVLACCNPAIGKIEEKIREKQGGTWKSAKEKVNDVLAPVLEEKTKKPSVLRVDTKALPEIAQLKATREQLKAKLLTV